ncbi:MAG: hypothetical protein JWO78_1283 [Micavibrio sp.]|nr:hypothetical protein [Micavibrio sp.]
MGFFKVKYSLVCLLAGVLSLTSLSSAAFADQEDFSDRLRTCKAIDSMVARTQCYDVVMDEYDLGTLKRRGGNEAYSWKIDTKKRNSSGSLDVTLTLPSTDLFITRESAQIRRYLVLSCTQGQPSAYISWGVPIGRTEGNAVADNLVNSKLGTEPLKAERWLASTDKTASFIPTPTEFYNRILKAGGTYVVTIKPEAYYDTFSATFDVTGLADKFQPFKESCHLP